MLKLAAQGHGLEDFLAQVESLEDIFEEGQNGRLVLELDQELTRDELLDLQEKIAGEGVTIFDVRQDDKVLTMDFQKNLAPLLILGLVLGGAALIPMGVFSWRFFMQDTEETMQQALKYIILPIGLILVAGMIIYLGLRRGPATISAQGVSI